MKALLVFFLCYVAFVVGSSNGGNCVWWPEEYGDTPCCGQDFPSLCGCGCQQKIYGSPKQMSCGTDVNCGCFSCEFVPFNTICCPSNTSPYCSGMPNSGYQILCCPATSLYQCFTPSGISFCSPTYCGLTPPCPYNCNSCPQDSSQYLTCGVHGGCFTGYEGSSCSTNVNLCDACKDGISEIIGELTGFDCVEQLALIVDTMEFGGPFGLLAGGLAALVIGTECSKLIGGAICGTSVIGQCDLNGAISMGKRYEYLSPGVKIPALRSNSRTRDFLPSPQFPSSFAATVTLSNPNNSTVLGTQEMTILPIFQQSLVVSSSPNIAVFINCTQNGGTEYVYKDGKCTYKQGNSNCEVPNNMLTDILFLLFNNSNLVYSGESIVNGISVQVFNESNINYTVIYYQTISNTSATPVRILLSFQNQSIAQYDFSNVTVFDATPPSSSYIASQIPFDRNLCTTPTSNSSTSSPSSSLTTSSSTSSTSSTTSTAATSSTSSSPSTSSNPSTSASSSTSSAPSTSSIPSTTSSPSTSSPTSGSTTSPSPTTTTTATPAPGASTTATATSAVNQLLVSTSYVALFISFILL